MKRNNTITIAENDVTSIGYISQQIKVICNDALDDLKKVGEAFVFTNEQLVIVTETLKRKYHIIPDVTNEDGIYTIKANRYHVRQALN